MKARWLARAAGLCLIAGYVDAIGYTTLGGVFAANMTGNTVLFAIAASRGDVARASTYVATLAAFLVGAIAAAFLRRATGRPFVALAAAAAMMLGASFAALPVYLTLALIAATMGLQGGAIARFGPTTLQTVVVTGTIVRLADRMVALILPDGAEPSAETGRLDALAWLGYGVGAAVAVAAAHVMGRPLILAALVLAAVAIDAAAEHLEGRG